MRPASRGRPLAARGLAPAAAAALGALLLAAPRPARALHFTEVSASAGVHAQFGYRTRIPSSPQMVAGGVAAGDFDGDGHVDLFVVGGAFGPAQLLRSRGDGTFEDVAAAAGVAFFDSLAVGPLFFDADGDGRLDLFVGSILGGPIRLLHNVDGTRFEDVTAVSGLTASENTFGASAADFDGDGRLDLFLPHWGSARGECHLWRNLGGRFECADQAGLSDLVRGDVDYTFTGNFADVDEDGLLDLLVTSDFGTSRVYLQVPGGHFRDGTGYEINDENGMGSAVGDYDGDGHLDWFVSAVWDPDGFAEGDWGVHGNRLYRNIGGGRFADETDRAGVREGFWGWAASFADLDNDGHLDLIHVNGFQRSAPEFHNDPTRLFMARGDGSFAEQSFASGLADTAQGRGIAVFDADGDGDLDLVIANNGQPVSLWRNDSDGLAGWLEVECRGRAPNTQGIGARIELTANGATQVRELRAGTNFLSQDPPIAHFGLGSVHRVAVLTVRWPDGTTTRLEDLAADRRLVVTPPASPPAGQIVSVDPNPFQQALRLTVPTPLEHASHVQVVDVTGRALRTLALQAGQRFLVWDGNDDAGHAVPAGVYWIVLPGRSHVRAVRLR